MKLKIMLVALCLFAALNRADAQNKWISFTKDKKIEQKVDSVLSLMTLQEKIAQMTQYASNGEIITGPAATSDVARYLREGTIGSVFNTVTVKNNRTIQEAAMKSRLKIPVLIGFDVIHGFRTIFPMPLAESCSWDLELMNKTARIAAEEASSVGIHWTFAPMVDIARDARWGRVMEGAGEDVFLGSLVAQARVKGFQGDNWDDLKKSNTILACAKHFAAYGAAESGRDYNVADISERTLHETYLAPFKAAKDAGVATFMTAFNEIGGVPCTGSKYLYTDILRTDWQFGGFAVSDHSAVKELVPHGVAENDLEATALALNAGVDMNMADGAYMDNLEKAVKEGKVTMTTIDNSIRRILEMKFVLGLFDDPFKYLDENREKNTLFKDEYKKIAREAVRKSTVLLKNDGFFPIHKSKTMKVALIGPMIKEQISLNGEWAGRGNRTESITLFDGLNEKYKNTNVEFAYAQGCDLLTNDKSKFRETLDVAGNADIILVAMGEDFNWSGEAASRTDIKLPGVQQELLKELKKLNKKIGLILFNGRPLDLSWENENLDAILEAWYPGTMAGHGVADVVAGDYNPSGKLTISFPRNIGQVPIYYNHKNTGRPVDPKNKNVDYRSSYLDVDNSPLYSFGYGLSYTTFEINNLKLDKNSLRNGQKITVSATVKNTGQLDGEEIVQLYVKDITASVTRPVKELKGFQKIFLKKGEARNVTFEISENDLKFYDINMNYTTEAGKFKLWVASSSSDNSNEAEFILQ